MKRRTLLSLALVMALFACNAPMASTSAEEPTRITVLFRGTDPMLEEPSDVEKYIAEQTGVLVERIYVNQDKRMLLAAAGDFETDLVTQCIGDYITGGLLMPLDELLAQFGPNILRTAHDSLEIMRKFESRDTGKIYWMPAKNHDSMADYTQLPEYEYQIAPLVRWDYYAELGYPEIATEDQLLDVLGQMMQKHPEQDGKKTYGISLNVGVYNTWYLFHRGIQVTGASTLALDTLYQRVNTCLDKDFVLYDALKFYNKANRMGILDPEMFTQTGESVSDKVKSGQAMFYYETWTSNAINTALQQKFGDAAYMGYPLSASKHIFKGYESPLTGWSFNMGVAASSTKAEAAIKFMDYLFTEEGSRVAANGVPGVHWDYDAEKQPFVTDLTRQNRGDTDWVNRTGVGVWHNWSGVSNCVKHPDGAYINLNYTEREILAAAKPYAAGYCAYYGVRYPGEAVLKAADEGKLSIDLYDQTASFTFRSVIAPDDIKLLGATVEEMWAKMVPRAILAESDEAFDAVVAEHMAALTDVGAQQLIDYYWGLQSAANEAVKDFY